MSIKSLGLCVSLFCLFSITANAQQNNAAYSPCTLHLGNTFGETLFVGLHPSSEKVFVDFYPLPQPIPLENQTMISSRLDFSVANAGYIQVARNKQENAFFSIDKDCKIHGYVGHHIAYSWEHKDENPTLIFCTTETYLKQGHC